MKHGHGNNESSERFKEADFEKDQGSRASSLKRQTR